MNLPISPAMALLQQLEILLRDPMLGPRVAQQIATTIKDIISTSCDDSACKPDAEAYAKLWMTTEHADSVGQQALISLASI